MPLTIFSVTSDESMQIVREIIATAAADGGAPVAVAVVDATSRLIAFSAMDNVVPASIKLAQSKAYSAMIGKKDTINWASFPKNEKVVDFDMRNWTDENFSGFTGGVTVIYNNQVIAGIGVSGRKGIMNTTDTLLQDNELAEVGRIMINKLIQENGK